MRRHFEVAVGDVFGVPLADGRFGAVRVLRQSVQDGRASSLVAVTPWLSKVVPDLDDPIVGELLRRRRGRFDGQHAIAWYTGSPPEGFVYLGRIASGDELALDPKGRYGGEWGAHRASDVIFEEAARRGKLTTIGPSAQERAESGEVDDVAGPVDTVAFWQAIRLIEWDAPDDEGKIAPILDKLASTSAAGIGGFHNTLCSLLYQLDTELCARRIGSYSYGKPGFAPDHFLDVRCAVVANGQIFYESVLADPSRMPSDIEFESLLSVAGDAYLRKTGRPANFLTDKQPETFSNRAGWSSR